MDDAKRRRAHIPPADRNRMGVRRRAYAQRRDFNCGERNGTSPVDAYRKTLSACGAVDMWGNCWEWTSTEFSKNGEKLNAVKGGAFDSKRTECRTELEGVGRNPAQGYPNVGFRIVRTD